MTEAATGTETIDTEIPGSPASVHSAADWLYDLKEDVYDGYCHLTHCTTTAAQDLAGKTAEAVEDYSHNVELACTDTFERARKAADVVRAFADQLGWRQDDMTGHRGRARDGGLTVSGYLIHAPTPVEDPGSRPKDATTKQAEQWQAAHDSYEDYLARKEVFDELREDVTHTRDELETWITDNLVLAEAEVLSDTVLSGVRSTVGDIAAKGTETEIKNHYGDKAAALRNKAHSKALMKGANQSRSLHFKSPLSPTQAEIDRVIDNSRLLTRWMNKAGDLQQTGNQLARRANVLIAVGFIGTELAQGGSPSQVLVAAGAGAGAAALFTASTSFLAPVFASAIVATGVGYAYEQAVPLHIRERIDEGLKDAAGSVADAAKDAWNSLAEAVSQSGGRYN